MPVSTFQNFDFQAEGIRIIKTGPPQVTAVNPRTGWAGTGLARLDSLQSLRRDETSIFPRPRSPVVPPASRSANESLG
jgi:hypothetical protein